MAANLAAVNSKIAEAAFRAGRGGDEVTLVAVSKTYPAEAVTAAVEGGATDIGESRVQEAAAKIDQLGSVARWHLIGHLQSNKAAVAVRCFDLIHSVDSIALAQKISAQAVRQEKTIECLIEVNSSGEDSKFGFAPADIQACFSEIMALPGIRLRGLMTIGPLTTSEGSIKKAFALTRELFEKLKSELGKDITTLSMGMSSDYETAIACGSTMVRVGTAIFGVRSKHK
ncbi:MAG: YggS family pyridoxal phosphate-dependent enzyme [FCB group bacterium]|nr:YggS family pyridoxal phosphate-dependent enzyme [FCB group bacterium]